MRGARRSSKAFQNWALLMRPKLMVMDSVLFVSALMTSAITAAVDSLIWCTATLWKPCTFTGLTTVTVPKPCLPYISVYIPYSSEAHLARNGVLV